MELSKEAHCALLTPQEFEEENLVDTAKTIAYHRGYFYVAVPELTKEHRLCELIEMLSGAFREGRNKLTGARICYEIVFSQELPVTYRIEGREEQTASRLSEILDALELGEDGSLVHPCQIIIDDEQKSSSKPAAPEKDRREDASLLVAGIFQQAVFLGLDKLDIAKKSEIRLSQLKDRFRASYDALKDGAGDFGETFRHAGAAASEEGANRLKSLADACRELEASLTRAAERPIKIAVMGTKKSGKSVIVNCLLGDEYAPTSSELPTPNRIDYQPWDKQEIVLEYMGKEMTFSSVKNIHDYIDKEFKKAQKQTGEKAGLADMVIHYPRKGLESCIIMDTPGPNFAGAGKEHERIAEECIKEADVCIFVMNYSNHLTNDEKTFLENVHAHFKEQGKFYSFFIAINRIDERYASEVEKSTTRLIDYLLGRLKGLDHTGVIAFGTSALSFFYMQEMRKLLCKDGPILRDDIEEFLDTEPEDETQLNFISEMYGRLKRFHGIKNPTDAAIDATSGIPQLIAHTRYIGHQKADMELVNHAIHRIDAKYALIRNTLLLDELFELKNLDKAKKEQIQKELTSFEKEFKIVKDALLEDFNENEKDTFLLGVKEQFKNQLDENIRVSLEKFIGPRLRPLVKNTAWQESDFRQELDTEKWKTFCEQLEGIVNSFIKDVAQLGKDIGKNSSENMQEKFLRRMHRAQQQISGQVEAFKKNIAKTSDKAAEVIAKFQWPEVEANFELPELKSFTIDTNEITKKKSVIGSQSQIERSHQYVLSSHRSFWENLIHPFDWLTGKKGTETVKEFDPQKCQELMMAWCEEIINAQAMERRNEIVACIGEELEVRYRKFQDGTEEFVEEYSDIFRRMQNDLQLAFEGAAEHEAALQKDLEMFQTLKNAFQTKFAGTWETVRDGRH